MLSLPVSALKTSSLELTVRSQTERGPLVSAQFPSGRSIPSSNRIESFSSLTKQVDFNGADFDSADSITQLYEKVEKELSPDPFLIFLLVLMRKILCMMFRAFGVRSPQFMVCFD